MDPASVGVGGEPERARAVGGMEYGWCRAVPGGTGTTLLAFRLARGAAKAATVQAALESLLDAHPVLRARLRGSSSGSPTLAFPSATPPLALELLPVPESAPDFASLLELELNRNPWSATASEPDADAPPVLFVTFYELPPPSSAAALFVRIHTAACDRAASASLIRELVASLAGDGDEAASSSASAGEPEDAAVRAALEERIPQRDSWKPFWARGIDMVGYSINGLRTSTLPFEVTGTERSTQMVRLGFDREETTRLLDACKQNGVKLCAAMAAATLLATRQSKQLASNQQETYSIATLINCRKFLEPALDDHNVGFFHSAITNTHTIHGGEGLWELAERCQDSYTNAKNNKKHLTDISDLNFLMCRAIENPQLTTASALRTAIVSVFEEPAVYELSDLQSKAGVEEFVSCATLHGVGPSIGMFDSMRDGQLDFVCMYPFPLHSRKQMQEILNKVKQILREGSNAHHEDCA
uniref:Phthiocerol/phthiodiolone dimycocerosyl transferase C-terminal domain-containing protein n=1 Tax=Leersia perrieri TaxID=77586 RepID=A0A0D9V833_9ORYZ